MVAREAAQEAAQQAAQGRSGITICDYGRYQADTQDGGTVSGTPGGTPGGTSYKKVKKVKNTSYTDDFERAWQKYPKRQGSNPKRAAFQAWRARLREQIDPGLLERAVEHYAASVRRDGSEHTPFVMQAATFFGPNERWREYLKPEKKPPEPQPEPEYHCPRCEGTFRRRDMAQTNPPLCRTCSLKRDPASQTVKELLGGRYTH